MADPLPLIGIPGRRRKGRSVGAPLEIYADAEFDVYFADYAQAVTEAGGLAVHLTPEADPGALMTRLDGVILPGGPDVDPRRYGQEATSALYVDEERDRFEIELVRAALERDRPILGICRGMQVVNVAMGGTLQQHVSGHGCFDRPAEDEVHDVSLDPGSSLAALLGHRLPVNSLHHQAVDSIGDGLRVVGRADDGIVEAVEAVEAGAGRVLAVQWHPEKLRTRSTDPLFRWLVEASSP